MQTLSEVAASRFPNGQYRAENNCIGSTDRNMRNTTVEYNAMPQDTHNAFSLSSLNFCVNEMKDIVKCRFNLNIMKRYHINLTRREFLSKPDQTAAQYTAPETYEYCQTMATLKQQLTGRISPPVQL